LDDDCDGTVDEEVCGGGPGCVQDADCREGVCYQGACALVCLGAGDICCDADGDRCVIESEWCGAPGPDLDPCPRARYWRTDVGTCLGVDCQAPQILANGSQDCRAAGFDVCIEGACVNDAGCGPAACGGQAEFFACSPTPDRARCVAGDCLGWASFLDQANGRGPVYQVPLQRPNRADRFEVRNDGQGDVWFDNASRLAWRPDAGPQPFTALNLVAAHQRCFDFGPGWRLPGLHDLVTLLGAPNVVGGGPLASRTTRFEQVKELNLPFVDEAVSESHVAGPGGRPFTFLCVQHEMGVVQPPIRLDQQGRDLWVGFEWVDLPELHASIADAETACRAQGATLARVEEIFARIDLRP
ncbi:MAG: hypothetical protein KC613_27530, partial [Myxococcales bacterium]|nr:hypothetical protein [Myxococcales bacterium]